MDASHVYVRALALGCFYSHISTQTFRRALTASLDSCAEIKSAPSAALLNLAEFGGMCRKARLGVWRKVPESDARSVEEGAGKRCSECGGRCRKAMLGVRRKVPESDARSVVLIVYTLLQLRSSFHLYGRAAVGHNGFSWLHTVIFLRCVENYEWIYQSRINQDLFILPRKHGTFNYGLEQNKQT